MEKFLESLRRDGLYKTIKRIKRFLKRAEKTSYFTTPKPILVPDGDYTFLRFREVETPLVTIIIPVHNKFQYTYKCLRSIYENTDLEKIEVIIADDGSNDNTTRLKEFCENVKVIRNETPLGFIRNCNKASQFARGRYLVFLNNDTQVQPGWLDELLSTIESNGEIGLVGPKFIYPDGRLQEAGGIIWRDATGSNYGRMDNPEAPEYNYLKEVDYISGACILVRRTLWERVGGFDERYSPAYYEDADLAFKIREIGYKVIYQPKAVVVHFEGITHGKDTSSGIKRFQMINREKFKERWRNILEREHLPHGEHLFLARDRSAYKKHVLIISQSVPPLQSQSTSKEVAQYYQILSDLRLQVTLIPDDFQRREPYTSLLQQIGIEVIYGLWYSQNIEEFFKENLKYFEKIFLNKALAEKYDNLIHRYKSSNTKLSLYTQELLFLQELVDLVKTY